MSTLPREDDEPVVRTGISLYEFYAIGIERLIEKSPWELERAVSAYHESFLTEQRCLGLAILLLLGESHVPAKRLENAHGYEEKARVTINQAVFLRALRHYFEARKLSAERADMVLERMQSYITDSRNANASGEEPLKAMFVTMCKRVPPTSPDQEDQYKARVNKIYDYIEGLVDKSLLKRYEVST